MVVDCEKACTVQATCVQKVLGKQKKKPMVRRGRAYLFRCCDPFVPHSRQLINPLLAYIPYAV